MISKLYMDVSVNIRLDQVDIVSVKTGRGVRQGCCLLPIILTYRASTLSGCSRVFGNFKRIVKVIRTAKYADDIFLVTKEQNITTERDW
jgi:hypothetical protein